ncbi:MAG: hypothetical protein JST78_09650 [Bacteroidetes bacterium]|nr:hypothetical protein [Bacteroidota bacterium]
MSKNLIQKQKMNIQDTKAFKELNEISQRLVLKRVNRTTIEDQIIIARNIGIETWLKSNPLQARWQSIVIEIIKTEKPEFT